MTCSTRSPKWSPDFVGGLADLRAGVLRHTGPAFAGDPLRALRGAQFAARFDFRLAPETAQLCRSLAPACADLPVERIWGEWRKLPAVEPLGGGAAGLAAASRG